MHDFVFTIDTSFEISLSFKLITETLEEEIQWNVHRTIRSTLTTFYTCIADVGKAGGQKGHLGHSLSLDLALEITRDRKSVV